MDSTSTLRGRFRCRFAADAAAGDRRPQLLIAVGVTDTARLSSKTLERDGAVMHPSTPSMDLPDLLDHREEEGGREPEQQHPVQRLQGTPIICQCCSSETLSWP